MACKFSRLCLNFQGALMDIRHPEWSRWWHQSGHPQRETWTNLSTFRGLSQIGDVSRSHVLEKPVEIAGMFNPYSTRQPYHPFPCSHCSLCASWVLHLLFLARVLYTCSSHLWGYYLNLLADILSPTQLPPVDIRASSQDPVQCLASVPQSFLKCPLIREAFSAQPV